MSPFSGPALYIHVPFCSRVCPYCDFAVQTGGPKKRLSFERSLLREIHAGGTSFSSDVHGAPFDTIYLGGGTPSSLSAETLESILATVRDVFPVATGAEITLEANPEDVSDESLVAWRHLGVTRLSIGVQSFDSAALEVLGRSHTPEQGRAAVERSIAAGFEAVSLDLIFAVPGQSNESWRLCLQQAVDLRPHHISCYELTIHPRTRFYRARQRGEFAEVVNSEKEDQFFSTHRFLGDAGYPAYEVSNFARGPEFRSRHNAKYWDHAPYLGLGPSAHSFDGTSRRWWNERRLIDWLSALESEGAAIADAATADEEILTPAQLVLEALALGLRTVTGVDLEALECRYGIDLMGGNAPLIEGFASRGWLQSGDGPVLVPTLEGMAVADTLAAAFEIPDVDAGTPADRRAGAPSFVVPADPSAEETPLEAPEARPAEEARPAAPSGRCAKDVRSALRPSSDRS